jgi:ADP-ribose pyrophosphatase YjhB (NUDIX family)
MVLKIEVLGAVTIPPHPPISVSTTTTTTITTTVTNHNNNDKINIMDTTKSNTTTSSSSSSNEVDDDATLMEYKGLCFPSDFTLIASKKTSLMSATSSPVSTITTTMFDRTTTTTVNDHHHHHGDALAVISDDDDNYNDNGGSTTTPPPAKPVSPWFHGYETPQDVRERISRNASVRVTKLLTAREVRDNQRYAINPNNNDNNNNNSIVRLVSGCIPILSDGRILLIRSRKEEKTWSLPKGGWELDESVEEGAIRETFEEAGVTGILGPCILGSFVVQSGKNKRKQTISSSMSSSTSTSSLSNTSNHDTKGVVLCDLNTLVPFTTASTIPKPSSDEEPSSSSTIPSHTHTCMTFFPMYVQQILEVFPENSRRRRAFPIDGKLSKKKRNKGGKTGLVLSCLPILSHDFLYAPLSLSMILQRR